MQKTIYIRSGNQEVNLGDWENLLTTVGDVESSRLELVAQFVGNPISYGAFEMASEQQAKDCQERFNGYKVEGAVHSVVVGKPIPVPPKVNPSSIGSKAGRATRRRA